MAPPFSSSQGSPLAYIGPAAENARIEEIETLVARPADLPSLLANQHRLALVYGDLWWANLYLEWHNAPPRMWEKATSTSLICRVGRVYQQTFIDAYSEVACGRPSE